MQCNVVDFAKDRTVYNVTGASRAELDNKLSLFFTAEGYKLIKSEGDNKTWEKGNRVLRILFGAFVKYHKIFVAVKQESNLFSVMVQRDSTGMSGGAIGMSQVRREFTRITEAFKVYFNN